MSYAKLQSDLLAAREGRQGALLKVLDQGWRATLSLSLAIPGADKRPPGALPLFVWARREAEEACGALKPLFEGDDALGPFALLGSLLHPMKAKRISVALESALPCARLIDLDVYDRYGRGIDRAILGLPPRRCLLCDAPARECIRLGRHDDAELSGRVHELLAPFTD